jgi:hypothetical protein
MVMCGLHKLEWVLYLRKCASLNGALKIGQLLIQLIHVTGNIGINELVHIFENIELFINLVAFKIKKEC